MRKINKNNILWTFHGRPPLIIGLCWSPDTSSNAPERVLDTLVISRRLMDQEKHYMVDL
jgi:hypothetical protein